MFSFVHNSNTYIVTAYSYSTSLFKPIVPNLNLHAILVVLLTLNLTVIVKS